jgi:hypothetical protein
MVRQMDDEPPRIARLRTYMVENIPSRRGHQAEARSELEQLPFIKLLHAYLKWAYRFVPPHPRKVGFAPSFWNSPVARSHGGEILALVNGIERGDDLSVYLSSLVRNRGYVPRRVWEQLPREDARWHDRDFVLNVLGLHHLHISNVRGAKGSNKRHGDELAFIEFDRDTAIFVYAGTHAEFRDADLTALSEEVAQMRSRAGFELRGISTRAPTPHDQIMALAKYGLSSAASMDGKAVPHAQVMSDGTPVLLLRHVNIIHNKLVVLEPRLDDQEFAKEQFEGAGRKPPPTVQFQWDFRYTGLNLLEMNSRTLFTIVPVLYRKV